MAYIIAHGTINGYNKVYLPINCGNEIQVITDIRAEFDNTSTMLEKPAGYLLQMSPNGVWISVVKLLFDGERSSGSGEGFFAFSAFLPPQQSIEGAKLKEILDELMTKYLSLLTKEYFTRNIGIDWSFVQQASIELDALCKTCTKQVKTNFIPSDKFAYVAALTDEQIIQYISKPFQPEYGSYKAVFIGTSLQNPNRQSTYSLLDVDVENEVYDIIWIGNTHDYPLLPKTVRKNQIDTLSHPFHKKHYESRDVLLSEGERDDINNTITIHVPQLEPIAYTLQLLINPIEAVQLIKAISKADRATVSSKDNHTLVFLGEQVEQPWRITIATNENYQQGVLDEIVPYDYIKENKECGVHLVRIQHIFVQINLEDKPYTKEFYRMIQFLNVQKNTIEMGEYDKIKNAIEFTIPEDEKFDAYYQISIQKPYCDRYQWKLCGNEDGTRWYITISHKPSPAMQPGNNPPVQSLPKKKTLYVYCPISLFKKSTVTYDFNGKSRERLSHLEDTSERRYKLYTFEVPENLHRKDISFYDLENNKLSFTEKGSNVIVLNHGALLGNFSDFLKRNWDKLFIIGLILILVILGIFVASYLDYIDIHEWFSNKEDTEQREDSGVDESIANGTYFVAAPPQHSNDYEELNRVLIAQKETWNYDSISAVVAKYDGFIKDRRITSNSEEYSLYKQLVWLQCRNKINNHYIGRDGEVYNYQDCSSWINSFKKYVNDASYADADKLIFLQDIVISPQTTQKVFHSKIKNYQSTIENKTFTQLKEMWESCKTQVQNNQSRNSSTQQINSSNNNQTSSEHTLTSEEEL